MFPADAVHVVSTRQLIQFATNFQISEDLIQVFVL